MSQFAFTTDAKSEDYCTLILGHMIEKLKIPRDEALAKMNATWKGLSIIGEDDLIYHQDVDYWAEFFVFGKCIRRRKQV